MSLDAQPAIVKVRGRPRLDPMNRRQLYSASIPHRTKVVMDAWLVELQQTEPAAHPGRLVEVIVDHLSSNGTPGTDSTRPPGAHFLPRRDPKTSPVNRQRNKK